MTDFLYCAGLQNVASWVVGKGGEILFTVFLVFLEIKPHKGAQTMSAYLLNIRHYSRTVVLFTVLPFSLCSFAGPLGLMGREPAR